MLHEALAVDRLFRHEPLRKFKHWYLPANQRIYTPPRPPAFYRRFIKALMQARPDCLGRNWKLVTAELGIRTQQLEELELYRQRWMV